MKNKIVWSAFLIFFTFENFAGIISTTPAITEIIYELGGVDKVVGVSDYCTYPDIVKKLPKVGTAITPNYEMILKLRPKFVLTQSMQDGRFENRLKKMGISTVGIRINKYQDILEAIRVIKEKLELKENKIVETILERQKTLESHKRKGTYALSVNTQVKGGYATALLLAGDDTFLAEIVNFTGLKNIASDFKGYGNMTIESLLKKNPDYLFVMTGEQKQKNHSKDSFIQNTFKKIKGKNQKTKILYFNAPYTLIPSSRIRKTMNDLHRKLKEEDLKP